MLTNHQTVSVTQNIDVFTNYWKIHIPRWCRFCGWHSGREKWSVCCS